MPTTKIQYGSSNQAVNITLASLSNSGMQQSDAVDNSTDLYLDALLGGKFTTGTSPSGQGYVGIYAYGTVGTGIYTSGASGSDSVFSADGAEEMNMLLVGTINTDDTSNQPYEFGPYSVAAAFGGYLPQEWGIVVDNNTGASLNASGISHDVNYQGIYMQTV